MNIKAKWGTFRRSVRYRLTFIVLASVLPVGFAAIALVYSSFQQRRESICQDMLDTTRKLSMTMDRELEGTLADLQVLAKSSELSSGDFKCLYDQTLIALVNRPGADIILADETGQQLINSYLPPGAPLPKRNVPERVLRIFETGKGGVSSIYKGAVTGRYLISIDVPVFRDGRVAYDLALTLPVDTLLQALALPALPQEWTVTILDSAGMVVARTRDQAQFVGTKPNLPALTKHKEVANEGVLEGLGMSGWPVLAGFSHSTVSGWTLVISVPKAHVMQGLWRWVAMALFGTAFLGAFGFVIALRQGRKISSSITGLIKLAEALGRGERLEAEKSRFTETQVVADALQGASDLLRQREVALILSEARFRTVVEDQTELIARYKPDGTYTFVNEVFCRFFGKTETEFVNHGWQPLAVPEDVPMVEERIRSLSPDNPVVVIENRVFDAKGEVRWMQFVNRAFFDKDHALKEIQAVGRDITELKRIEALLRESNERFSLLVQSAGDALYLADLSGRLLDVNHEAERQSGYTREELLGMHVVDLDVNDTPQMNAFIDPVNDDATVSFETRHRNKSGLIYPVEVRATPIRENGKKLWLGFARDITDRKNAEKFKADVEGIIRHDIKSPLTSLHALTELVERGSINGSIISHIPKIRRSIRQVIMLVDSSDKIMKMEQGEYAPISSRCSLRALFEDIRLALADHLAAKNVRLELVHTQQHLYGEEFLLEDMLLNLVKNAVEASPEGGCVMVTCRKEPPWDHIDIHNQGAIPPEIRERFFDKYVTSGKRLGTGLGTYSAQLIAKAHGGRIDFTTSETEGTTVTVILPCSKASS
ncbi:PAS domain S-box protein [Fundidesulfovibrio soli]|uniref:PAS domain S-box protein n=1 Tax=Fundidesulfovibrio soli TaxID=2922716 RepID=UPI001FB035EC|nr:PAS domain S-box protein [Fundidesulfovibrio soli]